MVAANVCSIVFCDITYNKSSSELCVFRPFKLCVSVLIVNCGVYGMVMFMVCSGQEVSRIGKWVGPSGPEFCCSSSASTPGLDFRPTTLIFTDKKF